MEITWLTAICFLDHNRCLRTDQKKAVFSDSISPILWNCCWIWGLQLQSHQIFNLHTIINFGSRCGCSICFKNLCYPLQSSALKRADFLYLHSIAWLPGLLTNCFLLVKDNFQSCICTFCSVPNARTIVNHIIMQLGNLHCCINKKCCLTVECIMYYVLTVLQMFKPTPVCFLMTFIQENLRNRNLKKLAKWTVDAYLYCLPSIKHEILENYLPHNIIGVCTIKK
jgi:hypothetical protein